MDSQNNTDEYSGASDSSTSIVNAIRSVARSLPDCINEDPRQVVGAILLLAHEICIEGQFEEQYDLWRDTAAESWCKISGEHEWIHDHCGFWGHQYCRWCRVEKYPESPGGHNECGDLLRVSESEYRSRRLETKMEAVLWIHGSKCRVLLKKDGAVIDTNDMWNNRASAELMILQSVPEARLRFVAGAEVEELNAEWDAAASST